MRKIAVANERRRAEEADAKVADAEAKAQRWRRERNAWRMRVEKECMAGNEARWVAARARAATAAALAAAGPIVVD